MATRFPDTPVPMTYWGEWYNALLHEKDNDIVAGVVYNSLYPTNSCDMHVASVAGTRWLTRPFLSVAFRYPFVQLGVRRVTLRIGADNAKALKLAQGLGFVLEGQIRKGWNTTTDLMIYGLLKEECRHLGPMNGKVRA